MGLFDFFSRKADVRGPITQPVAKPVKGGRSRFFNAAKHDLKTHSWPSNPVHIDLIIEAQHRTMVARSREQYANNDYVKNYSRIIKRNVVGPKGISMQAKATDPGGQLDKKANDAIEWAWYEWGKKGTCEVTGKYSWLDVEKMFISTVARDGECILRFIYGRKAGPWGFAVQMIDPQRIPIYLKDENLKGGGFIRNGIEFNEFGRPVAYYFTTKDTPEQAYWGAGGPDNFLRVPADEIVHDFIPEFIGQKRGIPWASSSLWRLRMIAGFEDAAITAARTGAAKMGFLTQEYETAEEIADRAAPTVDEDGNPCPADDDEQYIIDAMEAGVIERLPHGYKFEKFDPAYPSGEFDPFNKAQLRGASAGMGASYHSLTNDLTDVNFSSIRQGALDERDEWVSLQEWLIESLHEKVFAKWLAYGLLTQKLTVDGKPLRAERIDKYRNITWQGRRWQWIDPEKDANSAIAMVEKGLRSFGDVIREQGRDPEEVWAEMARDIDSMKKAGLSDEHIQMIIKGKAEIPAQKTGNNNDGTTGKDKKPG